ncbi:MAG: hypothetical protein ACRC3Y_12075 [Romboutsia sp.]|uniref:hypothetical protein n=1 Tax=Romboutsia sp. TaxID=1965302 RepID=UPI003F40031F
MIFMNIYVFIDKVEFKIFKLENNEKIEFIKDKIIIPKSFEMGDKLNYIRKFIITLINKYNVKKSNITVEDAIGIDIIDIVKMEGVIEEVFSNCGVKICR